MVLEVPPLPPSGHYDSTDWDQLRACSQIPVYGLSGWALGGWMAGWLGGRSAVPGAGFCGQNLGIKYIPCVGTHL